MKKIQPFNVWVNGQQVVAQNIFFVLNNDNLRNMATFYWCMYSQVDSNNFGNKIIEGNLVMTDADYQTFSSSSNANQYAMDWIAQKLGVTIIP